MRTTDLAAALASCALLTACTGAPAKPKPTPTARCRDAACLAAHQGAVIEVEDTFAYPPDRRRKGSQLYQLKLADGTRLVLPCPRAEPCRELSPALDGAHLVVSGVAYGVASIPERYGIVQSIAAPYLVELHGVRR